MFFCAIRQRCIQFRRKAESAHLIGGEALSRKAANAHLKEGDRMNYCTIGVRGPHCYVMCVYNTLCSREEMLLKSRRERGEY